MQCSVSDGMLVYSYQFCLCGWYVGSELCVKFVLVDVEIFVVVGQRYWRGQGGV